MRFLLLYMSLCIYTCKQTVIWFLLGFFQSQPVRLCHVPIKCHVNSIGETSVAKFNFFVIGCSSLMKYSPPRRYLHYVNALITGLPLSRPVLSSTCLTQLWFAPTIPVLLIYLATVLLYCLSDYALVWNILCAECLLPLMTFAPVCRLRRWWAFGDRAHYCRLTDSMFLSAPWWQKELSFSLITSLIVTHQGWKWSTVPSLLLRAITLYPSELPLWIVAEPDCHMQSGVILSDTHACSQSSQSE